MHESLDTLSPDHLVRPRPATKMGLGREALPLSRNIAPWSFLHCCLFYCV